MNCPKCGSKNVYRYTSHPIRYACRDCMDVFTEREASLTAQCLELEADRDVLTTKVEQLRAALKDAHAAIKGLPFDALGIAHGDGVMSNWSIRDELLSDIDIALAEPRT